MYIGDSIRTAGGLLGNLVNLPNEVGEKFSSAPDISRFLGTDPPSRTFYEGIVS